MIHKNRIFSNCLPIFLIIISSTLPLFIKRDKLHKKTVNNIHFSLNKAEPGKFVKTVSILFGTSCVVIAIFWLFFNINSVNGNGALWITLVFLCGFGIYMVLSGFGLTRSYIDIYNDQIILKKNQLLPEVLIPVSDIEKFESLPLNLIIYRNGKRRVLIRFGTTYYETYAKIIEEILKFAQVNNIPFEIIEEEL